MPQVSEVAVIGTTDEKWGERPLALIVLKDNTKEPKTRDVVNHVKAFIDKGLMNKLALLLNVRYVDSIAKTSVGKVNKKNLRETFTA